VAPTPRPCLAAFHAWSGKKSAESGVATLGQQMRDRVLRIRLTADELAALDRVAMRFDAPRSVLIRTWIQVADETHGDLSRPLGPLVPELPPLEDVLAPFAEG
jgi:hypothetical protein